MLKKLCACGNRIEVDQKRCSNCDQKRKDQVRYYDKSNRKNKDVYRSKQWTKLTEECKRRFNKIDVFAFYEYNIIKQGTLSHHIIEVDEDKRRIFDINNLIYVSDRSHAIIHTAYEKDKNSKREMQEKLFQYIQKWIGG